MLDASISPTPSHTPTGRPSGSAAAPALLQQEVDAINALAAAPSDLTHATVNTIEDIAQRIGRIRDELLADATTLQADDIKALRSVHDELNKARHAIAALSAQLVH